METHCPCRILFRYGVRSRGRGIAAFLLGDWLPRGRADSAGQVPPLESADKSAHSKPQLTFLLHVDFTQWLDFPSRGRVGPDGAVETPRPTPDFSGRAGCPPAADKSLARRSHLK